jgi:hypothetical protein
MAASPILHPAVRERPEPRMSAIALAKYLIQLADKQESILHDSRFTRTSIVTANQDAVRPIRAYLCDPKRPQEMLDRVKAVLQSKADTGPGTPKSRDEARRCAEIITLFQNQENALGLRGLALSEPPNRFDALMVAGVSLSIQPDFMVGGPKGRVGAGMLHVAKTPDLSDCRPETRERRGEHRREVARYLVAMLQMLLDEQNGAYGTPERDLCFVADLRLGETIRAGGDHAARLRTIRAACSQIAKLWPTIQPRPSVLRKP